MKGKPQEISNNLVPSYIRELKVYQAGKPIDELIREKNLERVSKLASNENPWGPSPLAIREMTKSLWDLHRYPDMHAYKLKKKLAEIYNLKRENIALGNGSEGIIAYIARAFLNEGSEVLTSENTFIGFYIIARSIGAKINLVPQTKDHKYDIEAMAKAITPETKLIYIANPNNPTGTYTTKKEFDYLMEHVSDHTLVILDEAYFEFARSCPDYPDSMDYRYDNVITLRSFSKAYGLGGIRVGYGFGHEDLIANLNKVKLPFEPNSAAQNGAWGALEDQPHLERTVRLTINYREECEEFLKQKGFDPIPSVTNFITFKTGSDEKSDLLYNLLLDEGVIIRPLKANEMPDYVRVSIGTEEEMTHFYQAMDKVMPRYNES